VPARERPQTLGMATLAVRGILYNAPSDVLERCR